ncbi:hypothetical protein J7I93_18275 [Bacillus sp. ISL-47]|uniref:hypothetical protein n=1 Tax=Bacillus sp. ISL-47 TaxID=2819130 RepID=UPI001BEA2D36|nr:hypothetical protein [Bacillus sp. ISL-47]MBT2690118.1 hypothetical protein [Bacillus sp. ISL-47]
MRKAYNRIYNTHTISEMPPAQHQQFFFSGEEKRSSIKPEKKLEEPKSSRSQGKKKQSIFAPKAGAVPFILPPPKVEAMQVSRSEKQQTEKAEPKPEPKPILAQSFPEKEKSIVLKRKGARIPDKLKDMLTPFSPMLSWSPSLPSKFSNSFIYKSDKPDNHVQVIETDQEQNSEPELINDALKESVDNLNIQEQAFNDLEDIIPEEHAKLIEEFTAELEETFETILNAEESKNIPAEPEWAVDTSELENEFSSLLEENAAIDIESSEENIQIDESSSHSPNPSSSLEEEFISMLEESSSDSSSDFSNQDEVFALLAESSFSENESSAIKETDQNTIDFVIEESFISNEESVSSFEEQTVYKEETVQESESTSTSNHDFSEESSYEGEFSSLLKKAWCMLDEQSAEESSLQHKVLAILEESCSTQEFMKMLKEAHHSEPESEIENKKYQKISLLLEEFSAMLLGDESKDDLAEYPDESSSSLKESKSESSDLTDQFTSELESSAKTESCEESSSCRDEESSSRYIEQEQNDLDFHDHCSESCHPGPIVKLPVLVAKSEVEINIFDCLPIDVPAKCITKMEWTVESLRCLTLLPSNTVFVKGVLTAEIQYVMNDKLHMKTSQLPFEKTINLEWLCKPEMPISNAKSEFTFQTENSQDVHYEFCQKFTEEINCQLKSIHVVWHHDKSEPENKSLGIQGQAVLYVDFLQEQYLTL